MRVTYNSYPESLVSQLQTLAGRQNTLQNQVATRQRIQNIEDDPAATQRTLNLQTENSRVAQYQKNIAFLDERATVTYENLRGLKTTVDRAGEIATLADGTKSRQELSTYATEINQMIEQGVQLMNARHRDDYIFGGTQSGSAPYVATKDANGSITAVTYQGNASIPDAEISENTTLAVQIVGENNTGSGPRGLITDSRSGADYFNHLISLRDHLLAGDTNAIGSVDRPAVAKDEENLLYHIGANGLVQTRLTAAATSATSRAQNLTKMTSNETEADLVEAMLQLSQTQNAYQAALQSGANLLGKSLMNYIS
jgi:flagellar hook-associated protein 3 FlgL